MRLEKLNRYREIALLFLFLFLFFATRVPRLNNDTINPDGVNWHYRSEQFVVGLKTFDFLKTYQHYHPGVTLMWITGVSIELAKQVVPFAKTYSQYTFATFDFVAKYADITVQAILSVVVIYLLSQLLETVEKYRKHSFNIAFLVVSLFSLEPFFLGNSRLYHMDTLLALLLFLALIAVFLTMHKFSWKTGFVAGVFLSLAFLTKSLSLTAIIYSIFFGGLLVSIKNGRKVGVRFVFSLVLPLIIVTPIIFPALLIKPFWVLQNIVSEGLRVGVQNGHGQIILGEYTRDPGVTFYPLVLLMKISPLVWAGIILYKASLIKTKTKRNFFSPLFFLSLFYLGYLLIMMYPSKKVDRYMLPMYPYLSLIAVLGFYRFKEFLTKKIGLVVLTGLIGAFSTFPLLALFPYYFTYTSPIFGSSENANKIIAQKPFGIGIYDLKTFIHNKYKAFPKLGFIDTKPMKSIYANSKVFDIRVYGVKNYDLLILGINEDIPQDILTNQVKFVHDSSLYINGLEYWRIYVKQDQKSNSK